MLEHDDAATQNERIKLTYFIKVQRSLSGGHKPSLLQKQILKIGKNRGCAFTAYSMPDHNIKKEKQLCIICQEQRHFHLYCIHCIFVHSVMLDKMICAFVMQPLLKYNNNNYF